jgi:hypothetical protein
MYCELQQACHTLLQLEIDFLEDGYAELLMEGEDPAALNFIWKEIQKLKRQLDIISTMQTNL